MDEKSKKTALTVSTIVTVSCLAAAMGLGVLSRWVKISDVFYYIIGCIALISMIVDTCIRKHGIIRFIMVTGYLLCMAVITILLFFG